jgi:hypothetical protein
MARGGYLASESALMRLARVTGDLKEASRLLTDALICCAIKARGCPYIEEEGAGEIVEKSMLRDLASLPPSLLGPARDIPSAFWKSASASDRSNWDFRKGYAVSSHHRDDDYAYGEVKFSEKDVNLLVALHGRSRTGVSNNDKPAAERLRDPSWEEWVAALATLAHEHSIHSAMKQAGLLSLIDARLRAWGIGTKDPTTVRPTARKVLERFKNNPPHDPYLSAEPKNQKP